MILASRAAEEIIIGEASAGAGGGAESDPARATQLALKLELRTGLGASKLLWRKDPDAVLDVDPELRARVAIHLDAALLRARQVIKDEIASISEFATTLLGARIVEGEELQVALCRCGMIPRHLESSSADQAI